MNNILVLFEVDTGAAVIIMSHSSYKQYLPHVKLNSTEIGLQTYTAEHEGTGQSTSPSDIWRVQGNTDVCCRGGRSKPDGLQLVTTHLLGLEEPRGANGQEWSAVLIKDPR